jgi:hypothetical protein
MSEQSRLIELLRKWEHPNKWEQYNSACETSFQAYQFAEELRQERDHILSPEMEEHKKKVEAHLKKTEKFSERCLKAFATIGAEVLEIRRLIEAEAPRLIRYFPMIEGIRDIYTPEQRAEMVRIVLGEILDGCGMRTKTNTTASASKPKLPPLPPKNPLVQKLLAGMKNPKNQGKTKHEIAMGITGDE